MPSLNRKRLRLVAPVALIAATVGVMVVPGPQSSAAGPVDGMECETSSSNSFSLTASGGYASTPDGNAIYMWSYGDTGGSFQLPGPTLCVESGAHVTVALRNALPEPTSIMFPGQNNVYANGKPAQPETDANGTLTSMTTSAGANSGTVTYTFTAGNPGTYLYQSGTDVQKQQQMGLYGALVVRPKGHADWDNNNSSSAFSPEHEYLFLLSEVDPDAHLAVERKRAFNWNNYTPRYFMINGRSMPDTIAPNHAAWLPSQPYGALIHIQPYDAAKNPKPALIRYLNAGTTSYPFHPHGSDEQLIARDGHPAQGPGGEDLSYSNFLIDPAPGQTIDTLMTWKQEYDPKTNPIPSDIKLPQLQDQIVGPGTETWFSEDPYLGQTNSQLPAGVVQNNQCGEYYHVAHSHALQQSTNFGASFGGMMTLIRIDPLNGCPTQ
ncbi:multicopper oxidase domain-containing protein [Planosporangium thailandense]|nr:multicopper oxidase domain-containing protein [Planosporangium thailandense]